MHFLNKFPKKWAKGNAFCNREKERKALSNSLQAGQHALIKSPRRYGKTSLAMYVLHELALPYVRINLFVAVDERSALITMIDGIKRLISQVTKPSEKFLIAITEYLKRRNLSWSVGLTGLSVDFQRQNDAELLQSLQDLLRLVEKMLQLSERQAVLFLDEFQEIGKLKLSKGIEAAIRGVAESSECLSFLFSGSNRHLLERIFSDDTRPLYNLCDQMVLTRISETHYRQFIGEYAQTSWGSDFTDDAYEYLFHQTQCHPYYVNAFCRLIWSSTEVTPDVDMLIDFWDELVEQEIDQTSMNFNELNHSQKKVLIAIANGMTSKLTGKEAVARLDLSPASITKALDELIKGDIIEQLDACFRIINPIMSATLKLHYAEYIT